MKMRGFLAVMLVLSLGLAVGLALAEELAGSTANAPVHKSTRPPKNLKKMADGHWTPWDPPVLPEGAKVHTVVAGDTLWDLSGQYLQNPYLWPQIWDRNRYILDSHWIYPGDPILVPAPEVVPEKPTPVAEAAEPEDERAEPPPAAPLPPKEFSIADRQDVYCSSWVQADRFEPGAVIAGGEDELLAMGQGNVVYFDAGSADGIGPGDKFTIVRNRGMVRHPADRRKLGTRVDRMGEATVIAVQEHAATAEITFACEDIRRGDSVVPFQKIEVPSTTEGFRTRIDRYNPDPSGKPVGYLIFARDEQIALGLGKIVNVDLGSANGLKPGDMITIYRPNPEGASLPRLNLGEGIALITQPNVATVKITASVRDIYVGDQVEIQ